MKGYIIDTGYMGLVNGKYMLFASEEEYRDRLYDALGKLKVSYDTVSQEKNDKQLRKQLALIWGGESIWQDFIPKRTMKTP